MVVLDQKFIDQAESKRVSGFLRGIPGAWVTQNSGNPGGGFSVRLRGPATISGSSDPLYIIDGVIVNNDSHELLDLGGYTQNRLIDIQPEDIERIEVIKGASAAAIYGSRASNGVVQIFTKSGKNAKPEFRWSSSVMLNALRKKLPVNETPLQWTDPFDNSNTETQPVTRYDFQDEFFSPAWGQEHHLAVRGGNEQTTYYASGGFLDNGGIIENTSFSRYTSRLNMTQHLGDRVMASLHANYVVTESQDKPNGGMEEGYGAITGFLFSDNANAPYPAETGVYPATSDLLPRPNPLEVVEHFDFEQQTNRFIGGIRLDVQASEKLEITYQGGIDQYHQQGFAYIPQVNTSSFPLGYANRASREVFQINSDLTLRHFEKIGWVQLTTVAGYQYQFNRQNTLNLETRDLDPFVEIIESGTITRRDDQRYEWALNGFFFQETVGWRKSVFLTLGVRTDASSVFANNQKWQLYPKANASWVLSAEDFWNKNGSWNFFKLRAAYGTAGNLSAIAPYSQHSRYVTEPINDQTGLITSDRLGNDEVGPERQREVEAGLETGFFGSRLGLEVTVYSQEIHDLILTYGTAPSRGFTSAIGNVGKMTNRGIEFQGRLQPIQRKNWSWELVMTYSRNSNELSEIPGDRLTLSPSFATSFAINGEALGVFYRPYYERAGDGSIARNGDGYPLVARDENGNVLQKVIGDPNPDWTSALTSELRYRNVSLYIFMDAIQGVDVFNWNRRLMNNHLFGGGPNVGKELSGDLPKGYGSAESGIFEAFVEDGSFVKFREIGLSYRLSNPFSKVAALKIELIGRNLWSFDRYRAWDPEVNTPGQNNGVRGFDFAEVPIPRTLLTKLTLTF
jgi:TonB-linked SusC/RagA family outer membrane protein